MTYDEWIEAVLALGRRKGLQVYYYEDLPRWGRRIGHFEGYCAGVLRVWAGAGEELLGPAVWTSPEAFTAYWPVCEVALGADQLGYGLAPQPAAAFRPAVLGRFEYRARPGRWVDHNLARVLKRAMEALL